MRGGIDMNRKASALFATGLMIVSALAAFGAAAGAPSPAPGTLLPAPGPRGSTPDNDSEPNNDFGNATLITGSVSFGGKIGQGDFDYFKIMLSSGATADTLKVTFTAHTGGGTIMQIFDPNRFTLLAADNQLRDIELTFTAYISGYYYIYLPELGPCDYTLTTVKGTAAFASDNDNQPSEATAIFPASGAPYSTTGTANNQSDFSDFFKVRLNYTELVSTDVLKAFLQVPPAAGFSLMLYAAGQSDALAGSVLPEGMNQTLTFSPPATGDYYLRVWAHHGSGTYSLKVSLFTGMADNNGMKEFASALDKTAPHWYNTSGDLTLGIDPDDFLVAGGAVAGQVFNCSVVSMGYDAQDRTPDIQIRLHDDLNELPPDPTDNLADPKAYANTRLAEAGNFFVQLNLTQWAGAYDLSVFTNSPPQIVSTVPNVTITENSTDKSIMLANVFTDNEDDPLTYEFIPYLDGWQANLTITVDTDQYRTVTIRPAPGWNGVFTMDINATDPYGETTTTNVQQVWVKGINHRPEVIRPDVPPVILEKNKPDYTQLNLKTVFSDPDLLDNLFFNVTGNESIRIGFPKQQENQRIPTGEVIFTPNIGFVGTEIMFFIATDNEQLASDPVMVTVDVVENITERLTVSDPPRLVMYEDSPGVTINLAANVSSNVPGDTFTFAQYGSSGNFTAVIAGSLVNITPRAEFFGVEVLTFNVTCAHGQKGVLKLTVEALWVNELPVVTPVSPPAGTWSVTVNETETVPFKITVSDEETPPAQMKVRWILNGQNVSTAQNYSLATDYDTVKTSEGSKMFVVRVNVNDSVTIVTMSWNVTVRNVNRAPTEVLVTFPPDGSSFDEGAKVAFIGTGTDPDGDDLTFQWYEGTKLLGTGMYFNTTKLSARKHNITLKVSDGTSSATFNIIVKVNPKPSPGFEGVWVVAAIAVAAVASVLLMRRRTR
jgi:hypothetical protein